MKRSVSISICLGLAALLSTAFVACDDPGSVDEAITQQDEVSDCGGFVLAAKSPLGDPETYCEAERLLYSYDATDMTLRIANNRVLLNCCGVHDMAMALEGDTYVITERDAPEPGGGRCDCMCVYDYTIQAQSIPEEVIGVRLVRDVTDSGGGPQIVWEGTLDLTAGTGAVEIDPTDVEPWCSGQLE